MSDGDPKSLPGLLILSYNFVLALNLKSVSSNLSTLGSGTSLTSLSSSPDDAGCVLTGAKGAKLLLNVEFAVPNENVEFGTGAGCVWVILKTNGDDLFSVGAAVELLAAEFASVENRELLVVVVVVVFVLMLLVCALELGNAKLNSGLLVLGGNCRSNSSNCDL